jgi:hypothetical protein
MTNKLRAVKASLEIYFTSSIYVVSSMQANVNSIHIQQKITRQNKENQETISKIIKKYEDLLLVHQSDKNQYLKTAPNHEIDNYNKAISHLQLLVEENKQQKDEFLKKARGFETKERDLNDYQKMIKSIVDANLSLKKKMNEKDKIADTEKEQLKNVLNLKFKESLNSNIMKVKQEYHTELTNKILQKENDLKSSFSSKLNEERKKMYDAISKINQEKNQEMAALKANGQSEIQRLMQEKKLSEGQKNELIEQGRRQLGDLKNKYAQQLAAIEGQFAENKNKMVGEFGRDKENAITKLKEDFIEEKKVLHKELDNAKKKIDKILEKQNFIKNLARDLNDNFIKKGIKASVDGKTGEVTLSFSTVYFDKGQYILKEEMKNALSKFIPSYAQVVLEKKEIISKIDGFEIIGFASPTFNKKYIDPTSISTKNFGAISFNLDLSYKRARSIFEYIFNSNNIQFSQQDLMFKMTKVSGRGFLAGREISKEEEISTDISDGDYCQKYNCNEQQKVMIRFFLKP